MEELQIIRVCQNCKARKIEDGLGITVTAKTIIDKIKENKCPFTSMKEKEIIKRTTECAKWLNKQLITL